MHEPTNPLTLLQDANGGCSCCNTSLTDASVSDDTSADTGTANTEPGGTNQAAIRTYEVTGLTCGHCVHAVTSALMNLDGVTEVRVDLVPDGTSKVRVASAIALTHSRLTAALDAAGNYHLV